MSPLFALAVLVSGGFAALIRYGVSIAAVRLGHDLVRSAFPYPVLVVNAVASLVAGVAAGWGTAGGLDPDLQLLLITAVAGGISTFSTFAVETLQLIGIGRWRTAIASATGNLVLGVVLAAGGYALGTGIF